jgi:hypothetical protein
MEYSSVLLHGCVAVDSRARRGASRNRANGDPNGILRKLREAMRRLTAVALLAVAVGVIIHFWQSGEQPTIASRRSGNASSRIAPVTPASGPQPAQSPTANSARTVPPVTVEPLVATPARFEILAPATVRAGDTFSVMIEVQALRVIRQLEFSVTYKSSILQLVGSSADAFPQQGGASAHFEEVSDGSLLVRIAAESGVVAGAGNVAVLEFQALKRGESPLAVQGVTYVEDGRHDASNIPTAYEGSLTVE